MPHCSLCHQPMAQLLVDFHLLLILFLVLCCRCCRSFCSISPTVSVLSLVDDMVDREILTLKQRDVMVLGKTEQAYTGVFSHGGPKYNNKEDGLYVCPLTSIPLFKSEHKFVTGSGWPSFYDVYDQANIKELVTFENRGYTEVRCAATNLHLGHCFNDHPPPKLERQLKEKGIVYEKFCFVRYCINASALRFIPALEIPTKGLT